MCNGEKLMNENISGKSALVLSVFILASLLNYFFYLIMAWLLKPSEFGIMGFFLAFFTILSFIVASGPPQTVIRHISSGSNPSAVLRDGLIGNLILGVIIASIFCIVMSTIETAYRDIITVLSVTMILGSISIILQNTLLGLFRYKLYALVTSINPIFKIIFPTALVIAGFSVFGVFIGLLLTAVLTILVSMYFIRIKFWQAKDPVSLSFFSQSGLMLFGTLSIMLLMNIDVIAVKLLSLTSAETLAGYYQSAIVLARFPVWITWALMMSLFPYISKNLSTGLIYTSLKYVLAFLIPISIALAISPEPYLKLLFPPEYLAASQALRVLAVGMGFLSLAIVLGRGFQALGREKFSALSLTSAVILQAVLLLILIPQYGIVGGGIATTIASILAFLFLIIPNDGYLVKRDFAKILAAYLIFSVLLVILPMVNNIETIISSVIAFMVYFVTLFYFNIVSAKEMESILSGMISTENYIIRKLISIIALFNEKGLFKN
jgi:stage V sporulation protein B